MKNYIYTNHRTNEVIEIQANSIGEADAVFEKKTGLNVNQATYVGVEIKANVIPDPIKDMIDNQEL